MLRSIYRGVLGTFRTSSGRKTRRRDQTRRLRIENLEIRKLLTAVLTTNSISDGNFEAPALAANAYQVAPTSSPWQYSGLAGVSTNNSGFTTGNPKAPQGSQVAFLKNNASMTQTVYLVAGVYDVSFLAAQRLNFQTQDQEIEVLVDGDSYGEIVPADTSYATYQSWNFTIATGTHNLELLGMSSSGDDSTAFIDGVSIAPVVDSLSDGGFDQPALAANSFLVDPSGMPWQFSGTAGESSNGSTIVANSSEAQNAPEGNQVGYIEESGSISQDVYLDGGSYQLSLLGAQRAIDQSNYEAIEVLVDGGQYGEIDPAGTQYASYQSSPFTVSAGPHTIELLGLDPAGSDNIALIDELAISPANPIADSSFETLALASGAYQLTPGGLPWQFSGGAGVSRDGSTFTSGNPNAPNGSQVAFINGTGSFDQSVDLAAGSYNLSFEAAQCANSPTQTQAIEVTVDNTQVGLITPLSTSYGLYETSNFTVAAGMHTIAFIGTNPQGGNNTALIDSVAIAASQDTITDGGFETPVLAANAYEVGPGGSPWQFSGLAGISANGSGFTNGNIKAPQGTQVGFIKNNGSMSYSVYLDADTYNLSFEAAQRVKFQTQSQQIKVLVDGAPVASITPSGTVYAYYQTPNFTVAAGVHDIQFVGTSAASADSTAFLDEVALTTVDESFNNASFETPALAAKSYALAPANCGWQFSGLAGISTKSSGFSTGSANPPAGAQMALIKDSGSISQAVYFQAGGYNISFEAAQRAKFQTQSQQIKVLVDGAPVAAITPSCTSFLLYQTANFGVTTGVHTIQFLGASPATADSTAFIDAVTITAGGIVDGSFEQPDLAAKTYQVAPAGTPWQFAGVAGISTDSSGFTTGNANAPDDTQVAFIKDTGSMSESVYLGAGIYNLSFMAAQRAKFQTQYESIAIWVDGSQVGSVTPADAAYGLYQTSTFTVTAGIHTIKFVGVDPFGGDNTAFIDDLQLT